MGKGAKTAVLVVVVIGLVAAAFWGGTFYASKTATAGTRGANGTAGGPSGMPQMTDAERTKLESMTDEERQAYMQEKMGGQGGGAGAAGSPRGGSPSLEGSVVEVSGKTVTLKLTSGGSSTVYLTDDTVMAYAEGAEAKDLAAGDNVLVIATPAADNVMNATAVVVK